MSIFGSLAPASQIIQSDDELRREYASAGNGFADAMNAVPDAQSLWDGWNNAAIKLFGAPFGATSSAATYLADKGRAGESLDYLDDITRSLRRDYGYSGLDPSQISKYDRAALQEPIVAGWDKTANSYQDKLNSRAEAAQRQTEAYGQMQGGNYFGGMLNEGYSSPSGAAPSTVGGLGGLGGMPATEANPFAAYNATWQPEATQRRAGSWGSPFGGW